MDNFSVDNPPEKDDNSPLEAEISVIRPDDRREELLDKIAFLKSALEEKSEQLQTQTQRLKNRDLLIAQQTEELEKTREQLQEAFLELQRYRHRYGEPDNIFDRLESALHRLALLERHCAIVQEDYQEKTQKLQAAERSIEELQTRLHRQQRYTIQYKNALDRCLGASNTPIEPEVTETLAITPRQDEELFAEIESIKKSRPDWPSPIIAPRSPKYSKFKVDLPAFIRDRSPS